MVDQVGGFCSDRRGRHGAGLQGCAISVKREEPVTLRHYLEGAAFVGVWMACGWVFQLETLSYNIVGSGLALVFQLCIARGRWRGGTGL
jgi:hypothetical protein